MRVRARFEVARSCVFVRGGADSRTRGVEATLVEVPDESIPEAERTYTRTPSNKFSLILTNPAVAALFAAGRAVRVTIEGDDGPATIPDLSSNE